MRYPFLAVLAAGPAYGYELRSTLQERFGEVLPPLNAGQVYTTLGRLERDGLVAGQDVVQERRPNKRVYSITDAGRTAIKEWVERPTTRTHLKDEFFLKLVLAAEAGLADARSLIARERQACLQALRDLDELATSKRQAGAVARLMLEGAALHLEADLKWLDRCEAQLERGGGSELGH
jgi:DNA-binding PadR family transcriptional regulator